MTGFAVTVKGRADSLVLGDNRRVEAVVHPEPEKMLAVIAGVGPRSGHRSNDSTAATDGVPGVEHVGIASEVDVKVSRNDTRECGRGRNPA
jgi:hypothetical protein